MITVITTGAYSDKHVVGLVETEQAIDPITLEELLQEFHAALGIDLDVGWYDSEEMTEALVKLGLHDPDRGIAWVTGNGEDYFISWLVKFKEGFREVEHEQTHI